MEIKQNNTDYQDLVNRISTRYEQGRSNIAVYVNTEMVNTYWQIGQYIVEFEQGGSAKAAYGKGLLENLSKDLSLAYGKGFSLSNLYMMRQFFIKYPIFQTASGKLEMLSWSHICEILPIDDEMERQFYEVQCVNEHWNVMQHDNQN